MEIHQLQALYFLLENYNYFMEQEETGQKYQLVIQIEGELVTGEFLYLTPFKSLWLEVTDVNFVPKKIIIPKNYYTYYPNVCFKKLVGIVNQPLYKKESITQSPTLFLNFLIFIVESTPFKPKKYQKLPAYLRNPQFLNQPELYLPVLKLNQKKYSIVGLLKK